MDLGLNNLQRLVGFYGISINLSPYSYVVLFGEKNQVIIEFPFSSYY